MIRQWYRSRLFWLGIPGLLFLLWAWIAFDKSPVELRWDGREWGFGIMNGAGVLSYGQAFLPSSSVIPNLNSPGYYVGPPSPFSRPEEVLRLETLPLEWQGGHNVLGQGDDFRTIKAAHWLLTVVYLASWLGATAAWQRRKARLLKASTAPPP